MEVSPIAPNTSYTKRIEGEADIANLRRQVCF